MLSFLNITRTIVVNDGKEHKRKKVRGRWIKKTKEDVDYVVASLLSLLWGIRTMVYYMGMSGLDIYEKNVWIYHK